MAGKEERIARVVAILEAVQNLSLVVRGNMDNAEPVFIVGGIGKRKTHYFENVVQMDHLSLKLGEDLKSKLKEGYRAGLLEGYNFDNEDEIKAELNTVGIGEFFADLKQEVRAYYESLED